MRGNVSAEMTVSDSVEMAVFCCFGGKCCVLRLSRTSLPDRAYHIGGDKKYKKIEKRVDGSPMSLYIVFSDVG
jgi:hypothetical protein